MRGNEKERGCALGFVWVSWHILGQCKAGRTTSCNMTPRALPAGTAHPAPALLLLGHFGFTATHPHGLEGLVARAGSQG